MSAPGAITSPLSIRLLKKEKLIGRRSRSASACDRPRTWAAHASFSKNLIGVEKDILSRRNPTRTAGGAMATFGNTFFLFYNKALRVDGKLPGDSFRFFILTRC